MVDGVKKNKLSIDCLWNEIEKSQNSLGEMLDKHGVLRKDASGKPTGLGWQILQSPSALADITPDQMAAITRHAWELSKLEK